jgi:hypothetical protein
MEITANQKELYQKAKDIGTQFLMIGVNGGENPLISVLQGKWVNGEASDL